MESEARNFVVGEVGSETKSIQKDKIQILALFLLALEGVVSQGASRNTTQTLYQVIQQLVDCTEQIGVLTKQEIQVLLELAAFLCLHTSTQ